MRSNVGIRVNVTVTVREGDGGRILRRIKTHNLVTDSGLNKLRDLLGYPAQTGFSTENGVPHYIALGTDSTAAAAAQTALVTEVFRKRITRKTPDTKKITFYLDVSTSEANGNDLKEAGLFTGVSGGTLWARVTHTTISKTASISVQYQWDWTFAAT